MKFKALNNGQVGLNWVGQDVNISFGLIYGSKSKARTKPI